MAASWMQMTAGQCFHFKSSQGGDRFFFCAIVRSHKERSCYAPVSAAATVRSRTPAGGRSGQSLSAFMAGSPATRSAFLVDLTLGQTIRLHIHVVSKLKWATAACGVTVRSKMSKRL